jgi:hypothetical protein
MKKGYFTRIDLLLRPPGEVRTSVLKVRQLAGPDAQMQPELRILAHNLEVTKSSSGEKFGFSPRNEITPEQSGPYFLWGSNSVHSTL